MSFSKPFHRNYRDIKKRHNSGYSSWAYIIDREYAIDPAHYVRAYKLIQRDLENIFEFVEPSNQSKKAFSYRIHALLIRTCIEIEANFKSIFSENTFKIPQKCSLNINDYRKIDVTHHLSSYKVSLPIWNGAPRIICPFKPWRQCRGKKDSTNSRIDWYQAYNASKHDRHRSFKEANFENLINAVAGLLIVVTSQFGKQEFSAGSTVVSLSAGEYHSMRPAIGSLFRIQYPDDWLDEELYDFDWRPPRTMANSG